MAAWRLAGRHIAVGARQKLIPHSSEHRTGAAHVSLVLVAHGDVTRLAQVDDMQPVDRSMAALQCLAHLAVKALDGQHRSGAAQDRDLGHRKPHDPGQRHAVVFVDHHVREVRQEHRRAPFDVSHIAVYVHE